jgi:hypothetical protein
VPQAVNIVKSSPKAAQPGPTKIFRPADIDKVIEDPEIKKLVEQFSAGPPGRKVK